MPGFVEVAVGGLALQSCQVVGLVPRHWVRAVYDVLLHLGIEQVHLDGVALVDVHVSEEQTLPVRLVGRGRAFCYHGDMVHWVLTVLENSL